jgi:II/X family phage/plasmid replication protein
VATVPGVSIDTVKLVSPRLAPESVAELEPKLDSISRVAAKTGEVTWQISTGSVEGSHQSSVHLRIQNGPDGKLLIVEGSVHKLALGHNVLGNAVGFRSRAAELVGCVAQNLGAALSAPDDWSVQRVDVARVFDLGSPEAVAQFFRGLRGCIYPRRKVNQYGLESIHAPGVITSVKLYHKGPEFKAHGGELRKQLQYPAARFLQGEADKRLRVEVEIKPRRLATIAPARKERRKPFVREVFDAWLEAQFDRELDRLMRERRSSLTVVRRQDAVHARLREVYARRRADNLFGVWTVLSTHGEDGTRARYPRSSFFRNRKLLQDAGVAWTRTDSPDAAGTPDPIEGLTLRRDDPRRCTESIDDARAMLERAAASSSEGD